MPEREHADDCAVWVPTEWDGVMHLDPSRACTCGLACECCERAITPEASRIDPVSGASVCPQCVEGLTGWKPAYLPPKRPEIARAMWDRIEADE